MQTNWRNRIRERFPSAKFDEPLARHTTFRLGGPADCYLEISSRGDLRDMMRAVRESELPVFFLGWGSNLLVLDKGIRGVVLRLRGEFEAVEFPGGLRARSGAGVRVPQLVSACAEEGLSGAESLVGVPGTVGGALVMNAGTRDGEIGALVSEVEILDEESLEPKALGPGDLHFSYRSSNLLGRMVLGCVLQLKEGSKVDIIEKIQRYQQRRLQTQPIHTYNVGSIFKNPPGRYVAKLIEDSGLKGMSFGGARVSPKHANFIENFRGATAQDVLELVRQIRERVRAASGVDLELEVKIIGEA